MKFPAVIKRIVSIINSCFFLSLVLLVAGGCTGSEESTQGTAPGDSITGTVTTTPGKKLVTEEITEQQLDMGLAIEKDTVVIDGKEYYLTFKGRLDTTKKLSFADEYETPGEFHKINYSGYGADYSITLSDPSGEEVFTRKYDKSIFENNGLVTISNAYPARFAGYNPEFDALLFTQMFGPAQSDWLIDYLLIVDMEGNIRKSIPVTMYTMIVTSKDKKVILIGERLVNADGTVVDLSRKGAVHAVSELINDSTVLVIDEYNDTLKTENARLVDKHGRVLKEFEWRGYYQELSYAVSMHYEPSTGLYYMIDDLSKQLRIIDKKAPAKTYSVSLDKVTPFKSPARPSEKEVDIYTGNSTHILYIDTISGKTRYIGE